MKVLILSLFLASCGRYNGIDGRNSVIELIQDASQCENGGITVISAMDINNNNKIDILIDANIRTSYVCNGIDGQDGNDGENGINGTDGKDGTLIQILNPCGDATSIHDEVLLKFDNGTLLASFSQNASGLNTRFSVLTEGNYITTDGDNCKFSVDVNGNIYNERH